MGVTDDVDLGGMMDALVLIAHLLYAIIASAFVSVDCRTRKNLFTNHRKQGSGLCVWHFDG